MKIFYGYLKLSDRSDVIIGDVRIREIEYKGFFWTAEGNAPSLIIIWLIDISQSVWFH